MAFKSISAHTSFKFPAFSFQLSVSSFEFQVSSFKFQVSSFKFRVSSFEFQVSSFKFQVSSFKSHPLTAETIVSIILEALSHTTSKVVAGMALCN
ncbi:Uncharacterized protein dnm_003740 [Desulfonema magnum]|uniref:Uncharacterized protein n=1 Tax=Desulfonema magnum TaxID=45655 RepID=A0A975BFK8_9BACT|nr:Uncharacterized protein dnm_003740 [Desulfonema magnum]